MEPRVARLESDVEYIKRDIGEIKTEVSRLLWAGIAATGILFGSMAYGYFRLQDRSDAILEKINAMQVDVAVIKTQTTVPIPPAPQFLPDSKDDLKPQQP